MDHGELDAYISKFEQVVRHAGFDVNDPMVLDKFTDGLPHKMYEDLYTTKHPRTYEQWRQEAINQQRAFIHLKARLNNYRTTPRRPHQGRLSIITGEGHQKTPTPWTCPQEGPEYDWPIQEKHLT